MRAHKVDGNQSEIVAALRATGHQVVDLSGVGGGCPDLLCSRGNVTWLLECKVKTGKLGALQIIFLREARGPVIVARSAEEAIRKGNHVVSGKWRVENNVRQLEEKE